MTLGNLLILVGGTFISLIVGSILGYYTRQAIAKKQVGTIEAKLNNLVIQAKNEAKEILFKAKEKAAQILEDIKDQERERQRQLSRAEERLYKKEQNMDALSSQLDHEHNNLKAKALKIKKLKNSLIEMREEGVKKLETISGLSQEQAQNELLACVEKESGQVLVDRIRKLEDEAQEELGKKAQRITALAMQRYAASQANEITSTSVTLPNDELKGRIIGKEGRNIKTLERLTGVEILVDDTPGAIIVSGFNPVRRQVAKLALEKLLIDGRIQPARIEEAVEKANQEITEKIKEAGDAAVYDVGITNLNPLLVKVLGRLRFRTSYGQNVLLHSVEVAHLSGMIASEIGADVEVAKKAGLLHDIGKAVDHEIQGSHVEIGRKILKKFNEDEKIIVAMQSHHEEYPYDTVESIIVQVADTLSSARPGARKDTLEAYLKRLEDLEKITNAFDGVDKSYAIQAGREIRVFVKPEMIDDFQSHKLAKQIADQIQQELKYPGEIKVSLIRETRVIEYAR